MRRPRRASPRKARLEFWNDRISRRHPRRHLMPTSPTRRSRRAGTPPRSRREFGDRRYSPRRAWLSAGSESGTGRPRDATGGISALRSAFDHPCVRTKNEPAVAQGTTLVHGRLSARRGARLAADNDRTFRQPPHDEARVRSLQSVLAQARRVERTGGAFFRIAHLRNWLPFPQPEIERPAQVFLRQFAVVAIQERSPAVPLDDRPLQARLDQGLLRRLAVRVNRDEGAVRLERAELLVLRPRSFLWRGGLEGAREQDDPVTEFARLEAHALGEEGVDEGLHLLAAEWAIRAGELEVERESSVPAPEGEEVGPSADQHIAEDALQRPLAQRQLFPLLDRALDLLTRDGYSLAGE